MLENYKKREKKEVKEWEKSRSWLREFGLAWTFLLMKSHFSTESHFSISFPLWKIFFDWVLSCHGICMCYTAAQQQCALSPSCSKAVASAIYRRSQQLYSQHLECGLDCCLCFRCGAVQAFLACCSDLPSAVLNKSSTKYMKRALMSWIFSTI